MKDTTTVVIHNKTKEELDKLKVHPRQSYNEVIANLIKEHKGERK